MSLDDIINYRQPKLQVIKKDNVCHFMRLPLEIRIYILSFLTEDDYMIIRNVCIEWCNFSNFMLWKDSADIAFPDVKWLGMQEWQQLKMLDQELDDYWS